MNGAGHIAVVGGGASGLAAAITAASHPGARVVIYERADRVGKKLLTTGNGRCNLTNRNIAPARYHGGKSEFIRQALDACPMERVSAFFDRVGLLPLWEEEDGRCYPYSLQASAVLDLLRVEAERTGVETLCDTEIVGLRGTDGAFQLKTDDGRAFPAGRVIVAAGGLAGTNDKIGGYPLLGRLGHRMTALAPALVQVRTDPALVRQFQGVKVKARASCVINGKVVREETGEVLFTSYGLSGPPILQLSRAVSFAPRALILLDLLPDFSPAQVRTILEERARRNPERRREDYLTGLLHKRVGQAVLKESGVTAPLAGAFAPDDFSRLTKKIKALPFPANGVLGFREAQVTAGGASTDAFDPSRMESLRVPGLFACGEILDVDGDCGGFNLHFAWVSGILAGTAAAE